MSDQSEIENEVSPLSASRRGVLTTAGAAAVGAVFGFSIPFRNNMPAGLIPVALADEKASVLAGKAGLKIHNDRPINMETPPHLLDDGITPGDRLFVRNNGNLPEEKTYADTEWFLAIDGEVETPLKLSIADLKSSFENVTYRMVLECAGNGRAFYEPAARGNQWTFGAVGNPEWTGVRLRDVLNKAKLKPSAVYTAHFGADTHLSGDPAKQSLSRGMPVAKALDEHTLIAWAMNKEALPRANGYPLRLVAPGLPGSVSHKWVNRIWVRDREHDGQGMTGQSYRMPRNPVAPGTKVPNEDMEIISAMPVKSLITFPETGHKVKAGEAFEIRGHAWAGDLDVSALDVSVDFGATWTKADLEPPPNKFSWQRWTARLSLPEPGYYEIWARATDAKGRMQPQGVPGWNPRGYLNNMQHRIAVFAA